MKITSNKKIIISLTIITITFAILALQTSSARDFIINEVSSPSTTYFTVNGTSGNVGIGTSAPTASLHISKINPNIKLEGGADSQQNITFLEEGSQTFFISSASQSYGARIWGGGPISLGINNDNLYIATNGNIGIGTASPETNLHIVGNITQAATVSSNATVKKKLLEFSQSTNSTYVKITLPQNYNSNNNGGSIRVKVSWLGDHATFGAYQEYILTYASYHASDPDAYPHFSNIQAVHKSFREPSYAPYNASTTPNVKFYTKGITEDALFLNITGHSQYNTDRLVEVEVTGRSVSEPMVFYNDSTAPAGLTEISKTIEFNVGGTSYITGGNVGIGTTTPSAPLTVKGAGSGAIALNITSGQDFVIGPGFYEDGIMMISTSGKVYLGNEDVDQTLYFVSGGGAIPAQVSPTNSHFARDGGVVGIGTDAAAYKLQVNGNVSLNNSLYIPTTGNVGIGTANPSQKLDVRGAINASSWIYANNGTITINETAASFWYNQTANKFYYNQTTTTLPASAITAGTFGSGNYVFPNNLTVTGNLTVGAGGLRLVDGNVYHINKRIDATYQDYGYHYLKLFKMPRNATNEEAITVAGRVSGYRTNDLGMSASAEIYASRGWNTQVRHSVWKEAGNADFKIVNLTDAGEEWIALMYDEKNKGDASIDEWEVDFQVYVSNVASLANLSLTEHVNSTTTYHSDYIASEEGQENYFLGGDLGIGTSAPSTKLTVNGTVSFVNGTGTQGLYQTAAGDVGIRTTSPTHRLNIVGTANITDDTEIASTLFINESSVGIGDSTPSYKLDVNGNARFTSTANPGLTVGDGSTGYLRVGGSTVYDAAGNLILDSDGTYTAFIDDIDIQGNELIFGETGQTIGDYGNGIYLGSTSYFQFETESTNAGDLTVDTNTLFIDASANRIGIGTTSPRGALDIQSANYANLTVDTTSTGNATIIIDRQTSASESALVLQDGGTDNWRIGTMGTGLSFRNISGNSNVFFQQGGNVGIGTSSPTGKLHIAGSENLVISDSTNARNITLSEDGSGYLKILPNGANTGVRIYGGTGSDQSRYLTLRVNTSTIAEIQGPSTYSMAIGPNSAYPTAIYLSTTGLIGLGTASPGTRLQVGNYDATEKITVASGTANGALIGLHDTSTSYGFTLNYSGSVGSNAALTIFRHENSAAGAAALSINRFTGNTGIGTSSASGILHLKGNATAYDLLYFEDSNNKNPIWRIGPSTGANGGFGFYDSTATRLWIQNSSGRVGIGTTAPSALLDIKKGGAGVYGLNASGMLYVNDTNVGVGTATPADKLDIDGSVRITNGYGPTTLGVANYLKIGAAGNSPNASSIAWGDNTGWKLNFGTIASSTFSSRVTFVDTGNVGIGTEYPSAKLHVNGNAIIGTLASGSTDTVIIHNGSGLLQERTIDSRVWGSSLADFTGTMASGYATYWSDTNTVTGEAAYTYDASNNKLSVSATNGASVGMSTTGYVEDVSGIVDGNYVSSRSWSAIGNGTVGIFNQNGATTENRREWGTGPHGQRAILWAAYNDVADDGDGGWDTTAFTINTTKTYRVSVWIKKTGGTNGSTYLGISGSSSGILNMSSGVESNPYFWCGDLPSLNKWYLVVGYIFGKDDNFYVNGNMLNGGIYDGETGKKVVYYTGTGNCNTDFQFSGAVSTQVHRTYLYYDNTTTDRQYWWDPRFEEVSGKEPTVEALLGLPRSTGYGVRWGAGASVGIGYLVPESLTLAVNGSVGIGNNDTGYKLGVSGNVSLNNSLYVTSAGSVGVGTASPANKLNVVTGAINISTATSSVPIGLIVEQKENSGTVYGVYSTTTSAATTGVAGYFSASGATNNYGLIVANGNVGIGPTTPQNKLDVTLSTNSTATFGNQVNLNGSWSGIHLGYKEDANTNYRKGAIVFETVGDSAARGKIHILNDGTNDASSATLADSRLTVDLNGNVGIGTTAPSYTLEVKDADKALNISGVLYVNNTGVSIGNPAAVKADLHISKEAGSFRLTPQTLLDDGIIMTVADSADANPMLTLQYTSGSYLSFTSTGGSNEIAIAGNQLDINGHNVSFDSGTLFVNSNGDKVGIGTTTPAEKLEVNGNIRVNNTINVAAGKDLILNSTTGSGNVVIVLG